MSTSIKGMKPPLKDVIENLLEDQLAKLMAQTDQKSRD